MVSEELLDGSQAAAETRSLLRTLTAYALYRSSMQAIMQQKRQDYIALPDKHKQLLPDHLDKIQVASDAISDNADVAEAILAHASVTMLGAAWSSKYKVDDVTDADIDKVRQTLKQLWRDWSKEGQVERDACYGPIYCGLQKYLPRQENYNSLRVLTPGCGLGRLTVEIANMGFDSVGNDFSYPMLACSNFILNKVMKRSAFTLHMDPQVFSNRKGSAHVTYCVPDEVPTSGYAAGGKLSMAMGDFIESFSSDDHRGTFDAVATCFFLDTAHNILEFLDVIKRILKPGGLLINHGPFLYHHENAKHRTKHGQDSRASHDEQGRYIGSIELTASELQSVMEQMGFVFKESSWNDVQYLGDRESNLMHYYRTWYFVSELEYIDSST